MIHIMFTLGVILVIAGIRDVIKKLKELKDKEKQ